MKRLTLLRSALAALLSAVLLSPALAAYPERPIKLVVPFPAGGSTDMVGRLIAQQLTQSLGQAVTVENRPGAGTVIGTDAVAKAAPDGYTLLLASSSIVLNRLLVKNLPYDAAKAFVPVIGLVKIPHVLVVHPSVPANNLAELIALARAKPGALNYASTGNGTLPHVMGELFLSTANVNIVHVPYNGTSPALQDLLAGRVQMLFDDLSTALPNLRTGRVRAIGMTSAKRSAAVPEYPTLVEGGLAGYDAVAWFGVSAPAGTPAAIVQTLNTEIARILASPDFQKRIAGFGDTPEQVAHTIRLAASIGLAGGSIEDALDHGAAPLAISEAVERIQAAGVRRASLASSLYRTALQALVGAAREVLDQGTFGYLERALPSARLGPLMSGIPPASKP